MSDHPITIPSGLNELLQNFALAILRNKPDNLIEFASIYFQELLEKKAVNSDKLNVDNSRQLHTLSVEITGGKMDIDSDEEPPPSYGRGRRGSVFAPTYVPTDDDDNEREKVCNPKTDEQRLRLSEAFDKCFLFKNLEIDQKGELLDAMFEKRCDPDEHIIQQGDDGDNFYIIESGYYEAYVNFPNEVLNMVYSYDNEGSFGELALLYNTPRKASVISKSLGIVWALDRDTFKRIVCATAHTKRKTYEKFLRSVPMLASLDEYEILNLSDALERRDFVDNECIIKQGDKADEFYLVTEGVVSIRMRSKSINAEEIDISDVGVGGYFGELALLTNNPRAASVYAKGKVTCAALDVGAFERLLGPCLEIMKRNFHTYEQQLVKLFGNSMDILKPQ